MKTSRGHIIKPSGSGTYEVKVSSLDALAGKLVAGGGAEDIAEDAVARQRVVEAIQLMHSINYSILRLSKIISSVSDGINTDKIQAVLYGNKQDSEATSKSVSEIITIGSNLKDASDADLHAAAVGMTFLPIIPEGVSVDVKKRVNTDKVIKDPLGIVKKKMHEICCSLLLNRKDV